MTKEFQPKLFDKSMSISVAGRIIDLSAPKVMGVINITPDSFYAGSRISDLEALKKVIDKFIMEGVDILDIGAYSSRPSAEHIDQAEELKRLETALKFIKNEYPDLVVSVDTFRSYIAKIAVEEYGVSIVNDISAGYFDKEMFTTISHLGVPYIMMHMKGTPQTMQKKPLYENLMKELIDFFAWRLQIARDQGIKDIIIDPGFGFGKTLDRNYQLLQNLDVLKILDCPMLVGLSRKSMIYNYLDIPVNDSLVGTITLNTIALLKGANILRVHDVKEAVQTVKLFSKLNEFPLE